MKKAYEILKTARENKQRTLSEYESKLILAEYGIPVVSETIVSSWDEARKSASEIGYPVVLKVCSPEVTHKTEQKLIEINLRDERDLETAFKRLYEQAQNIKGEILVQKMITGARELVIGLIRDPQFGPCVMFGLGGIFTEILHDVSFRVAPFGMQDAMEIMEEIKAKSILNAIRGMDAVDRNVLGKSLVALGNIGLEHESVKEIDVNPMIVHGSKPVAVDALVVLNDL
ncbi:MAG: acetate--CoA ligase family protein [Deltaproteobacteria bacterium]|nr:acetate--CoA ligase family protein [Deltaproteobacteria bacterium]